jgi:hypothetical protein
MGQFISYSTEVNGVAGTHHHPGIIITVQDKFQIG